ncbi:unnamed protein product [Leptidea sinapis]|uniref:Circadian locomoter output cycles protein kaput n=1 Tax=Leptidea sinapis TaxID=189913 RepID=A0A5E4PM41_9NEOP|nr:unnamed protein product [Leptidea sinapis]
MDDDGDDKDDTKRRTRNLSEKKRRDQFNMLVNELSAMVSTSNRKMDKSTVLKSTISFLKNHNEVTVRSRAHDVQEDWKPQFLSNEEFTYLVLEALEGFVMVFSATGQIYYVSESIASLLGHNPITKLNFSVTSNAELWISEMKSHTSANLKQIEGDLYQQDSDSRVLFVCTGKLNTPQLIRDVSLVDSSRSEFTSRHSLEWKFLFLDHRAPPIIGYLPFEVLGTSGYDYYHFDDLDKVVTCHEALMQKGELTSCYYRFLTKGQQWIWLQTRFYITYHQWNSKPEFVMCTHLMKANTENTIPPVSPAFMSEASEAYGNSFLSHNTSQNKDVKTRMENTQAEANFGQGNRLQRKHEELQEMIMRQQEELRQVKEQLLLARLGILQPIINVHNVYTTPEDLQPLPAQMYDRSPTRNPQLYPPHHQGLGGNNTDQNQQHHPNE